MKKETLLILSTGFALFSMFFGSGNLVFPLAIGMESGGHYGMASLGVLCTCVIFPFLGMLGMALYNGEIKEFFSYFGKKGIFIFSFIALGLMGPFGVLARCLTVIHGACLPLFPSMSLPVTSLVLCVLIYLLTANKNKIVSILGVFLTPFLLLAVASITGVSLYQAPVSAPMQSEGFVAFTNGFFKGYQTMDLVAAFFFSGFVIKHLLQTRSERGEGGSPLKFFIKASVVGAVLLYVVYFALVLLGWFYAPLLEGARPQEMFGKVAIASLGFFAAPCICVAVVLACLTTAIALTSLFAEFLRTEVFREKIGNTTAIVSTLIVAFLVSTLEFSGIAQFLGPILETMYPALIVLTVVNIGRKVWGMLSSRKLREVE